MGRVVNIGCVKPTPPGTNGFDWDVWTFAPPMRIATIEAGTVPYFSPPIGHILTLAGRKWHITLAQFDIDYLLYRVIVEPAIEVFDAKA